jgi:hypothetical protein
MHTRTDADISRPWYKSRKLWWVLFTFLLLIFITEIIVRTVVSSEFIQERINKKLTASNSGYRVEIGEVSASLLLCRVTASAVTISDTIQSEQHRLLAIDTISVTGLNPLTSWLKKGISTHKIRIKGPVLTINDVPILRYQAAAPIAAMYYAQYTDSKPEIDTFLNQINLKVARKMPYLNCHELIIDSGSLTLGHIRKKDTLFVTATEINIKVSDILFDTSNTESMSKLLFARSFTFDINGPHQIVGDSLYEYRIGHVTGSSDSGTIKLDSASIALIVSEEEFAARSEYWAYQFKAAVRGLVLHDVDFTRLLYQQIVMRHLEIDSSYFYMFSDKRQPKNPKQTEPLMANEAFQKIPWYVQVDSISIHGGKATYAERSDDGTRPGTITFTHTNAMVRNVTNDPARMTDSTPAVFLLEGRIEDSTTLSASMHIPLLSRNFNMSYRGITGKVDARIFNAMFMDLEGYRITSGIVDSVKFDITIKNGHATGTMIAPYRDLDAELISKEDHRQGLVNKIKSFVFDFAKLRNNNTPGESYKVGQVDFVAEQYDPFMKVIWASLRSGIFSLIGVAK